MKQTLKHPSYDVNVPPWVRYDFTLTDFEFRLYIEIRALTDLRGYCWASNGYFSKLLNKSESTISRTIQSLGKKSHIKIEIDKEKGNDRKLFIESNPIRKNADSPIRKNADSHPLQSNVNNDLSKKSVPQHDFKTFQGKRQVKNQYKNKKMLPVDVKIEWFDEYLKKLDQE